jgi:Helix-turn-helix domain
VLAEVPLSSVGQPLTTERLLYNVARHALTACSCCVTLYNMLMRPSGARIRELRGDLRLSIRELARLAEVDYTYLSRVERGYYPTVSADWLGRIASGLGVSIVEICAEAPVSP